MSSVYFHVMKNESGMTFLREWITSALVCVRVCTCVGALITKKNTKCYQFAITTNMTGGQTSTHMVQIIKQYISVKIHNSEVNRLLKLLWQLFRPVIGPLISFYQTRFLHFHKIDGQFCAVFPVSCFRLAESFPFQL